MAGRAESGAPAPDGDGSCRRSSGRWARNTVRDVTGANWAALEVSSFRRRTGVLSRRPCRAHAYAPPPHRSAPEGPGASEGVSVSNRCTAHRKLVSSCAPTGIQNKHKQINETFKNNKAGGNPAKRPSSKQVVRTGTRVGLDSGFSAASLSRDKELSSAGFKSTGF